MHLLQATSYKLQARQGFTLIEVSLYLGVLATLIVGVSTFVDLISQARVRNQVIMEVEQQAVQISQILNRTISAAQTMGDAFTEMPVLTGPFKMERFQQDKEWVVVRHREYWGPPPLVARVLFVVLGMAPK